MSTLASIRRVLGRTWPCLGLVLAAGQVSAGGAVSSPVVSLPSATASVYTGADGNTYQWGQGSNQVLDSITVDISGVNQTLVYQAVANNVKLRRVANANDSSETSCGLFVERTADSATMPPSSGTAILKYKPDYPTDCDMAAVMGSRTINRGVLDLFLNDDASNPSNQNQKNIERVDFLFQNSVTAPASLDDAGFVVIEKSGNNVVKLAAVTAVDSNGDPSAYGTLVSVGANGSGEDAEYWSAADATAFGSSSFDYLINTHTDNQTSGSLLPVYSSNTTESLYFSFVSLDDLGVTGGAAIHGFSYFASDVSGSNLVDYTTFPRTTGSASGDEADLLGGTAGLYIVDTGADFDGDGIPDSTDPDDDNDNIIDTVEGDTDTDGDGMGNRLDTDSDGDGILDDVEDQDPTDGVTDTDGDGIPDYLDIDSDNDAILDSVEGSGDVDGDGKLNYLDLDSDGDGLSDLYEQGKLNVTTIAALDTDNDGEIDGTLDFGSNGYQNSLEDVDNAQAVAKYGAPLNSEYASDLIPDFLDQDSDNDGLSDAYEAGFADVDGNGVADNGDNNPRGVLPNNDNDNRPDYLDVDSDNDGIFDALEAGSRSDNVTLFVDNFVDTNGDGAHDAAESSPLTANTSYFDADGDGVPNHLDLDSDNDGISDVIEANTGADANTNVKDTDFDGRIDIEGAADFLGTWDAICSFCDAGGSPYPVPDTDSDGTRDFLDNDSDGDTKHDIEESGNSDDSDDSNDDGQIDDSDFVDANNDGWDDNTKETLGDNNGVLDTDDDGLPNFVDTDSDNDGEPDVTDDVLNIGDSRDDDCNCDSDAAFYTGVDGHGGGAAGLPMLSLLAMGALLRRRRTQLVACSLLMLPLTSNADNSPEGREMNKRIYIGAGVGMSKLTPEEACDPCYSLDDDSGAGGKVFLGMDVSRSFSVEAYYADLGEAEVSGNGQGGEIGYQHYGVSALGYLYNSRDADDYENGYDDDGLFRREGLSAYGRVGVGKMDNTGDADYKRINDAQLHLGVGAEYGWENGIAARAEYTSFDTDVQWVNVSVLKRLGDVDYNAEEEMVEIAAQPMQGKQAMTLSGDDDDDGVPNHRDVCPLTPPGVKVNELGCNVDRDGDGVPNNRDRCHGTPAGVEVGADGCPQRARNFNPTDRIQSHQSAPTTIALDRVQFEHNSDRLTVAARLLLDQAAKTLIANPSVKVIAVGHTCGGGQAEHNAHLSLRRSKMVARYLVYRGVDSKRLRFTGKGATMPLVPNNSPENMSINRRVEFVLSTPR